MKDGASDSKDDLDICYKTRMVAKGHAQKEDEDCNEIKHTFILVPLAPVTHFDMEPKQMDVKLRSCIEI